MKKALVFILVAVLALTLVACDAGGGQPAGGIDMSKYPTDINEWTAQNFNDYFTEAGVYTEADWVYIQDHASYYPGMAPDECGGYMDDAGLVMIGVWTTDPTNGDADVEAFLKHVRENKAFPADLGGFPVDHLVGDVIFWYSFTTDEAVYNAFDAAYKQLIEALGVTPDF